MIPISNQIEQQKHQQIIFTSHQLLAISRWLTCIVVVKFDINQGQLVQHCLPVNQCLSKTEQKEIAMLSFPDSNSFDGNEGSLTYIFRFNGNWNKKETNNINNNNSRINKQVFGYTCFKQNKDSKIFRGYFQKSLVILSPLPLLQFYEQISQLIVFRTFSNETTLYLQLQKFLKQVALWPNPEPNIYLQLPVIEYKFKIKIPDYQNEFINSSKVLLKNAVINNNQSKTPEKHPQKSLKSVNNIFSPQSQKNISNYQNIALYQDIQLLQPYKNHIKLLWNLWQIAMLNKPLLVISENPRIVSHSILSLLGLITPFQYMMNFKPYATVYDPEIQQIQDTLQLLLGNNSSKKKNQNKIKSQNRTMIIGGTNPVFLKILKKIQNIINLDQSADKNLARLSSNSIFPLVTKPPQSFLKLLLSNTSQEKLRINQTLLKSHFFRLVNSIIKPLENYFLLQTNDLKRFEKQQFLKFINVKKQQMFNQQCIIDCFVGGLKGIIKFYDIFIQSNNFEEFLKKRKIVKILNQSQSFGLSNSLKNLSYQHFSK